jgi:hypothetical protein
MQYTEAPVLPELRFPRADIEQQAAEYAPASGNVWTQG